ncbi:MAG: inositol monophosphatase [Candidatus Binataceae bacterium]|nr:inositol monophosphatase [Candidatus Binataceae bacterium]
MDEIERVALRAARAAGKVHLQRLRRINVMRKAANPINLVTEADHEAEAAVIAILQRAFPSHAILAEESGASFHGSEHRWIIDPLDGTTNFAHGYPQFCVSIAYERRGRVQVGVIFDALKKECFVARRGKGARLNGHTIRVSGTDTLGASLLGTGFPYDRRERRRFYLAFWEAFMMRVQGVRRTGSAALDLAYVACGRVEGFWEFGLRPWDVAAGALIVEEAGGRVTNMDESALDLEGGRIVASNSHVHRAMLDTIAENWQDAERRQFEIEPLSESVAPKA